MEWLFVYDGGWWLKITDVKQLTEYHKRTDGKRYEGARSAGRLVEDLMDKKAAGGQQPEKI